ncbi:MAG: metal-sulfur cluster assembly factor [Desulfurococcaceae archaeon]|nr:metal-sulfur cluster assembly factor [Desulfurococcaceae archaeon]
MVLDKAQVVERVKKALSTVYDPEIPISVWDLGLVYGIDVDEERGIVRIRMTLTAPACPVSSLIIYQVQEALYRELADLKEINEVNVDIVLDPPWDPSRMTEEGRRRFRELFGYDIAELYSRRVPK